MYGALQLFSVTIVVGLTATAVTLPTGAAAQQDRSIFSVLDTQGRSVSASASAQGVLSATDFLSAGGRRVQVWSLSTLPGEEIQVDLRSADFDAFLYVVGPGLGEGLRDDDSGDGLNSRLCMSVSEPGEYRVVASSLSGGLGAFTLEVSERPGSADGVCGGGDTASEYTDLTQLPTDSRLLRVGDDVDGTLSDADPVVFEAPAQAWAVEGQAGQPFSVDLISDVFDAYLMVEGPGLESWLQDDDGAGRCDARVTFTFPQTGTYRVVASTLDEFGGPFRMVVSEQPGPANPNGCMALEQPDVDPVDRNLDAVTNVGALSYEVTQEGVMTGGEGLYDGRYVQGWALQGSAGSRIAIEMRSAGFDSYLYLSGPGFPDPIYDDDGAGNLHSRICVELPREGTYNVLAGPLSGDHAGEGYSVRASLNDAASLCDSFDVSPEVVASGLATLPTEGRTLQLGTEAQGFIDLTAARHPETNQLIQPWSFQAQAGQTVYVDVVSADFDPLLYVVGPGIEGAMFVDDAPGDGCNTRMEITPSQSGTLQLLPGSYYEQASGNFVIRASTDPPVLESGGCVGADAGSIGGISSDPSTIVSISSGANRRLEVGTEADGELGPSEEALPTGEPAQAWSVTVQAGVDYIFELLSEDFDPVLYLDGPGLFTPLMDDDGAGSLDSRIEYTASESGSMRLVVTALTSDGSGAFRLRAIRRVR